MLPRLDGGIDGSGRDRAGSLAPGIRSVREVLPFDGQLGPGWTLSTKWSAALTEWERTEYPARSSSNRAGRGSVKSERGMARRLGSLLRAAVCSSSR